MPDAPARRRTTQVALAGLVRAGDCIVDGDRRIKIVQVRRAQGRKPAQGENLHLLGEQDLIKVNSLAAVRIEPRDI